MNESLGALDILNGSDAARFWRTGHFVYDDAPETAAEALATFLAEAAPR